MKALWVMAFATGFGVTAAATWRPGIAHGAGDARPEQYCADERGKSLDELNSFLAKESDSGWELVGTSHGYYCFKALRR